MTYCEQTGHDEFALHLNTNELIELKKLVTDSTNEIAHKLRQIIATEIVTDHVRQFLKERKIELCERCGGSGKVRVNITGTYDYDFETCPTCNGKTGRVKTITTTYEPLTKLWQEHFAK